MTRMLLSEVEKDMLLEAATYYLTDATTDNEYAGMKPGKRRKLLEAATKKVRG